MLINFDKIVNELKGKTVKRPISGTLSGHAAGEPFDKHAYSIIKNLHPNITYRNYEYLNKLYLNNLATTSVVGRHNLIKSKTNAYLLNRSTVATLSWKKTNQFDEKQNDTADILVTDDSFFEIIDVKTKNLSKNGQAPNIISAEKLVQACSLMIDNKEFEKTNITYLGIDWELKGDNLTCKDAYSASLFKANPSKLYINWSAALQIQFHVESLDQTFTGSREDWCYGFIKHYIEKRNSNVDKILEKKIKPYLKYLG